MKSSIYRVLPLVLALGVFTTIIAILSIIS